MVNLHHYRAKVKDTFREIFSFQEYRLPSYWEWWDEDISISLNHKNKASDSPVITKYRSKAERHGKRQSLLK